MNRPLVALAIFLAASLVTSAIGGLITAPAVAGWYQDLARPFYTPPDWLFAPVWTALYATMAVAAWLVWRRAGWNAPAIRLYWAQLALNFLWSPAFFGLQSPLLGLVVILPLAGVLAATVAAFFRVRPLAGWLMVPYLAWVLFAVALNAGIWWLNR